MPLAYMANVTCSCREETSINFETEMLFRQKFSMPKIAAGHNMLSHIPASVLQNAYLAML
jgi:hypothetical protein